MSSPRNTSPSHTALTGVLVVSAAAVIVIVVAVFAVGGWDYYTTPLRVRAYRPVHRSLRPSGTIGRPLGVAGLAMMTVPVIYAVRKRWSRAARAGSLKRWLDVHIFCGTVGPVLVTFHAALKFNGVVSVAYWSMVSVMLSGFVGRYLYVRIPRSIRGTELSYAEIESQAAAMMNDLAAAGVPVGELGQLTSARGMPSRRTRTAAHRRLVAAGLDAEQAARVVRVATERAVLLRRLSQLSRTRRWFAMWHVFHLPLVYVMFAIAFVHVALAIYLGYGSLLQR
jgi:hypothetical protein